jgi:hypothetical protein
LEDSSFLTFHVDCIITFYLTYQHFFRPFVFFLFISFRRFARLDKKKNRANKMSIAAGDKVFYYMTRDSLCFLTMTEARYPKRLAFLYLDEVGDVLLQELVREFGNNVSCSFE